MGQIPYYDPEEILRRIPDNTVRGEEELKGLEIWDYIEDDVYSHKVLFSCHDVNEVYSATHYILSLLNCTDF